ncbi:MAG: hypothetical protein M3P91_05535 [Actinomycetota bacterium]|nr:hypothetical protein [Actinomycetota bacterium]
MLAVLVLTGCSSAPADGGDAVSATASATADEAAPAKQPARAAPPAAAVEVVATDDGLRTAVRNYSDAFLSGDPVTAYAAFSERCKQNISLSYFTGIVAAAKATYGSALPIRTYEAETSGDFARVTYTYDVPALNQTREPWSREKGQWRQDDC